MKKKKKSIEFQLFLIKKVFLTVFFFSRTCFYFSEQYASERRKNICRQLVHDRLGPKTSRRGLHLRGDE